MKIFSKQLPASMVKKLVIPSIGVLAFIIFSSFILFEATKATIDITENGETETVKTHANTVGELLKEQELIVGEHDWLSHDMDANIENGMEIRYKEAEKVIITIDGVDQEFFTTREVITDLLQDEGLAFSEHDDLSFDEEDEIVDGLSLDVTTAFEVTIKDAGEKQTVWTTGGSIADLLDQHEIALEEKLDKVKPALDEELNKDTLITITRVEKETDIIEEMIDFETETREDDTLAKGKEKVLSEGKQGTLVKTFEVTKENGKEVDRELKDEEIKTASENRVVAIGTKEPEPPKQDLVTLGSKTETKSSSNKSSETPKESKTDHSSKESETKSAESSEEVMYMNATAYSANCNGCSGVTATGINLNDNPDLKVVAVDPDVIPLGTKVWVEGYGNAVAGDTGGSIKGNRIDVHVPTRSDASQYGWKKVKVKILE
ncbi:MAG TPA: ubiquitin-like domain-containing protein [Candidatus Dormibacteraeota bacterium]|nr:ubiquitin-like domain-containing protein [Candidatus Dormibacteraeota bacterium]